MTNKKSILSLAFSIIVMISMAACKHSGLFSPESSEFVSTIPEINSDDVMVHMKTSGGTLGLDQDLFILKNRQMVIYDNYPDNGSLYRTLSQDEFDEIRQLFVENYFYSQRNAIDSELKGGDTLYEITYQQEDFKHSITANYNQASEPIQVIINTLTEKQKELKNSLKMVINTSSAEVRQGETVWLTLRLENHSDQDVVLNADSSRIYNFIIYEIDEGSFTDLSDKNVVWSYSLDGDHEALQDFGYLDAGAGLDSNKVESSSSAFTFRPVEWNGFTNDKSRQVVGRVAIIAELFTNPGGKSRAVQIVLKER